MISAPLSVGQSEVENAERGMETKVHTALIEAEGGEEGGDANPPRAAVALEDPTPLEVHLSNKPIFGY
jgi:hypothetical protein